MENIGDSNKRQKAVAIKCERNPLECPTCFLETMGVEKKMETSCKFIENKYRFFTDQYIEIK